MQDGRIVERGTYEELVNNNGAFAKFVTQFGGNDKDMKEKHEVEEGATIEETPAGGDAVKPKHMRDDQKGTALMQAEERAVGAVSGTVYHQYFQCVFRVCNPTIWSEVDLNGYTRQSWPLQITHAISRTCNRVDASVCSHGFLLVHSQFGSPVPY